MSLSWNSSDVSNILRFDSQPPYHNSRFHVQTTHQRRHVTLFTRITQYTILLVIGFVVVIFGLYFTSIQSSTVVLPPVILNSVCVKKNLLGINCKIEQEKVLRLYNSLVQQVQDKYIKKQCHNSDINPIVDAQTVFEFVSIYENVQSREADELVVLFKIIAKTYSGSPIGFDTSFNINVLPNLPIMCAVKQIFTNMFHLVFWIGIVALNVVSFYFGMCYIVMKNEKHKREVNRLVKNIIDSLKQEAQYRNKGGYLPIIHIRDQLIPPNERLTKSKIWADVEQYLELDSRVRSEVREIHGEDFQVWKWVQPVLPTCSSDIEEDDCRVQTSETKEDTMNSSHPNDNSCLIVCLMFGPDPTIKIDRKTHVKSAILKKCKDVNVSHIFVECTCCREVCVYVKFASPSEAAKAYKQLSGLRCDGKLVSVKFLCLDRYHQKFPDADCSTKRLRPINNEKNLLR